MSSQSLQLVTWEQAKRLKQVGFNWETDRLYCKPHPSRPEYLIPNNAGITEHYLCFAPTVALALKWMRDEKGMITEITYDYDYWLGNLWRIWTRFGFKTFEEAESALLDKLLVLIENGNS